MSPNQSEGPESGFDRDLSRRQFMKGAGAAAGMGLLAGTGLRAAIPENAGNVTVLSSNPSSGGAALGGKEIHRGVEMRLKEFEAQTGRSLFNLLLENDKCRAETAVSLTRTAISQNPNLVAWMGGYCSPTTLSTMKLTEENEILQIVTSFAPKVTEQGHPYIFRVSPGSRIVVPPQVNYAINQLGARRHAVLGINNAWGKAQTDMWKQIAEQNGAEVVSFHQVPLGQQDYSNEVSIIRASNPDVVYALGYHGHTKNMLSQMRDMGVDVGGQVNVFIGSIAGVILNKITSPETLAGVHAPLYFIGPAFANYPEAAPDYVVSFVEAYRNQYGSDPIRESATGYALAETLIQGMDMAGSSRDVPKIARTLKNLDSPFTTPLGPISFQSDGQALMDIFIAQYGSDQKLRIRQRPEDRS